MIKIEHKNLKSIANQHLIACKSYIIPRLDFYIDVFNSLGNSERTKIPKEQSLKDKYDLGFNILISLIIPLLNSTYKKNKKRNSITTKQVKNIINSSSSGIINKKISRTLYKEIYELLIFVKKNLNQILIGSPNELNSYKSKLVGGERKPQNDLKYLFIEKLFSYEKFTKEGFSINNGQYWNNYSLTSALDISVCPYCNRNWINTVTNEGDKVTNPQLDHFFSKADFPLLRLSFYNLIPSCETCNSRLKHSIEFEYGKHLHPYEEGYMNDCRFEAIPKNVDSVLGIKNNYSIILNTSNCVNESRKNRVIKNHNVFKIDRIYSEHGDILSELYRKNAITKGKYVEHIKNMLGLTDKEIYRLALGNYFDEVDFKKRPFAKLTKDVAKQIDLID